MAFWDNFEKKATDATANVMSKVKGVSDITRLNSMVTEEENRIKDIYFKIGQTYVKLHGQDNDPGFSGLLNALKASQLKIEKYKQEIMDIKGVQKCERCGAEVQNGASFCMSCGAPIPKVQPQPMNTGRICKKCGAQVAPTARFCTSCGTPYVEEKPMDMPMPSQVSSTPIGSTQPQGDSVPFTAMQPQVDSTPFTAAQPQTEETKKSKVCTNCGAQLQEGIAFCTNCGMPVKEEMAKSVSLEKPEIQPEEVYAQPVQTTKPVSPVQPEPIQEEAKNPAKNVCPNCGAILADNVRFCVQCGTEVKQPETNQEEPTMRVTPVTFAKPEEPKRSKFCIGCGAPLDADSVFCTECGKNFFYMPVF